jgi:hypothetical protein
VGLLYYAVASASAVKFSRLSFASLAIATLFTSDIIYMELFFLFSFIGLFTGVKYSPFCLFFLILEKMCKKNLIIINQKFRRFYNVSRGMDTFDHLLRVLASFTAIYLFDTHIEISLFLIAFMGVFILLSAFLGFCLSALLYIWIDKFIKVLK